MPLALILALVLAIPTPPLALAVYPMCQGEHDRNLWEIEADARGLVDVSSSPGFDPRFTRHAIVRDGDTFLWARSLTIYVRDHRDPTHVLTATQDGTPC
jgi:hypothetical protein